MDKLTAIEQLVRRLHANAHASRGYVIARRTSMSVHAKEFNVYSHGYGKLRVHFLGRDRIAKFDPK